MPGASISSIAIIGAGIGGLVMALAPRKRGIHAEVFEQSSQLAEIGAAGAPSANSTRELGRLGLLDSLARALTEPDELIWRYGRSGQRLKSQPVRRGDAYRRRFGAHHFGNHRASQQKLLSSAHGQQGFNSIHQLTKLYEDAEGVTLSFANSSVQRAQIVMEADGVRSLVRRHASGFKAYTIYYGTSSSRGILQTSALRSLPDPLSIQFWMGPGAHLLHYTIGGATEDVNSRRTRSARTHSRARCRSSRGSWKPRWVETWKWNPEWNPERWKLEP